jgi:Spy/CpxP family protein refolding chaperone
MRHVATLLVTLFLAACASTPRSTPGSAASSGENFGAALGPGLDLLPLSDWWHDDDLAGPLKLTSAEMASLDQLSGETVGLDKLRHDAMNSARDLRLLVDAENPAEADITAAGQRLRTSRDLLLQSQIALLAKQRSILTQDQWTALEAALRARAENRFRDRDGRGGRRGRGGYPGGRSGRPGSGNWPN